MNAQMYENDDKREMTLFAIPKLGLRLKSPISYNTKQAMVSCPFHKDNSPSMGIDIGRGLVHCFSCSWSGGIERLYKELTNRSLRKDMGYKDDAFSSFKLSQQPSYSFNDFKLKEIYINADLSSAREAYTNPMCADYLRKRGIPESVSKSMGFLFAEDVLINNNRFKSRLLIPIYEDNRLISVEGRRILNNDEVKVLYPRNSSVNTLFDIDNLKEDETLYAVEGLMDLAVLRTSSIFKNSTAIFGANITKRQLELLRKFKKVVYIYDLDKAGLSTVEKMRKAKMNNVYSLKLPSKINGVEIKDVGDLPKAKILPQDLVDRNWLSYSQPIC